MSSEPLQIKNAVLAAVLSVFLAGLGQIYNGQIGKGILLFLIRLVSDCLFFLIFPLAFSFLLWIYGMYDAYKSAERINTRGFA